MNPFLVQLRTAWERLTRPQRLAVLGVAGATIIAFLVMVTSASQPAYTIVFTNLSDGDAAAIVAKLKEERTPYQLANNGSTIRVPAEQASDIRLRMASAGLPAGGGVGFEIFNQTQFGLTDFTQRVNFQRALEGELSRTIARLDAVDQARVHLAIPQQSLFIEKEKEPTASIVLKFKPGKRLTQDQVNGIVHLASSSVEALKPKNVSVVDDKGNVLWDGVDTSQSRLSAKQQDIQRGVEKDLEREVQGMLDRVLGPNKAVVRVRADLNWDQQEVNREVFTPIQDPQGGAQIRSSKTVEETFAGPQGAQPGIPGAASNIPQPAPGGTQSGNVQFSRREVTQNNELSKSIEKVIKTPGSIGRLSVAVLMDTPALPPETVKKIEDAVTAAVGINPQRGDQVQVQALAFDRTVQQEQERAMAQAQMIEAALTAFKILAVIVIALVMLLVLRSVVLRRHPQIIQPPSLAPGMPVAAGELAAAPPGGVIYTPAGVPATAVAPIVPAAVQQVVDVAVAEGVSAEEARRILEEEARLSEEERARARADRERRRLERQREQEEKMTEEQERLRDIQSRAEESAKRRSFLEQQVVGIAKNNPEAVAELIRAWLEDEAEEAKG